jgi:hypothetical protein
VTLAPGACRAGDESLHEAIQGAAGQVLKLVKGAPVSVNSTIATTGLPRTNGGPGIVELLKAALERIQPGVVRDQNALYDVQGRVGLTPHPIASEADRDQRVLRLELNIVDTRTSEPLPLHVTRFITDNTSIIRFLQPSGPVPSGPPDDQHEARRVRNRRIQEIVRNPRTVLAGSPPTRICSSPASLYQVEVLAGPLGDGKTRPTRPRRAQVKDGLGFVDIERGEVYEVRVYNRSPEEVAIRVFIDGLDMFDFSDDRDPADRSRPKFTYLIVPPARNGEPGVETIPGWHKSIQGKENFRAFLVTEYGKGAASKEGIPASGPVGVIQVQFSRCYPGLVGGRQKSAANETGFGPPLEIGQTEVAREVEPPIDVVSIRYTR